MTEQEAREKLQEVLDWQYANWPNYQESNLRGDKGAGFVEFQITKIYRECNGEWDGQWALEFLNSLEAETTPGA